MKRIASILLFISLLAMNAYGQESIALNYLSETRDDQPVLEPGAQHVYSWDRRGKKTLTLQVMNVEYADSSWRSCSFKASVLLTAKGKDFTTRLYKSVFDNQKYRYNHEPQTVVVDIKDGFSVALEVSGKLYYEEYALSYVIGARLAPFVRVPRYDPTEYNAKMKVIEERQRKEEEARAERERARSDSIKRVYHERQDKLLTPECLANWVGASFFTKESIEKDCNVSPSAYNGGYVFYDFHKCPVTMEFTDASHVCTEISFRLFGEDGYRMKTALIEYGYKLHSKTRGDLIIENNLQNVQTGTSSIYKYKLKNGGYSTCRITEGQAMMFTFYRTKN